MRKLKVSTARSIYVFMSDSTNRAVGKAGLTLTITAGKNGGALSSISPTVNDRSNGIYEIQLTGSHLDTLGDFALYITATGADVLPLFFEIVAYDPQSSTNMGMSYISGSVALATDLATVNTIVTETRRIVKNKLTINTSTKKLELWDDAGSSVILSWDLTDKDGISIVLTGTGPANRGVPS